jgi:N-acetylglucosaminyldiphosphoundecaprenol N-acetyl-beta-D-mannosaminyltransferase
VIDVGKRNVLGVLVDALDYEAATSRIVAAAEARRPCAVTALAVHGVMTGVGDAEHRHRLNGFDMVTPDGQPVRWALRVLHSIALPDRVYGPTLTTKLLDRATEQGLSVYFYGSSDEVLRRLLSNVRDRWPALVVAGARPSLFRRATPREKAETVEHVRSSGADIVFVGLGCPRQEVFCWEYRDAIGVPLIAVGAAFDYLAGTVREPPATIQRYGLQWLYRLVQEPQRLWRRYLLLNPQFLARLLLQRIGVWRPDPARTRVPSSELGYA